MKVCQITTVHKQDDSRIFWKQCVSIAKAGHDCTLLVMNGRSEQCSGVNVIGVPVAVNGRINRILNGPKGMLQSAIDQDADIYHFHDPELLRIAKKLKKKTGATVIYDSHEDLPKQVMDKHWIPKLIRPLISKWVERYEKKVTSKIDGVISVTELICKRFKSYNSNVEMVANYPIIDELSNSGSFENKIENQICYIGGLFPTRGIKELVESLEFCNAKLVIAGKFSSKEFESEVTSLKEWKDVEFLGHIDRQGVSTLLAESNIGIVTLHPTRSYKEALPIKLFEYMIAGIPSIASDFEMWNPLVIGNDCGVMVDPMNPKMIGEAIQALLEDRKLMQKMGENGRAAALEKYSWESQSLKLLKFYDKLNGK